MRNLTNEELLMVSGAGSGMTISPEGAGSIIGGGIGGAVGGGVGAVIGGLAGSAIGNSLANGTRPTGSVTGGSGIPWGGSMGGPYRPIQSGD